MVAQFTTRRSPLRLALLLGGLLGGAFLIYQVFQSYFLAKEPILVVIDPAYPYQDNDGRFLMNETYPLKVNWEMAQALGQVLNDKYHVRIKLTREHMDDVVSPEDRADLVNETQARLLVRLDCSTRTGTGFRVYYPDQFNSAKADPLRLFERSEKAASQIHQMMEKQLHNMLFDNDPAQEREIPVAASERSSYYAEVPSVTIEVATLSNMFDALFINSDTGQMRVAEAIAEGIVRNLRQRGEVF